MSPERWQQIQALFHEAAARAPAAQAAFLETACGGDAALSDQVAALLAADADAPALLDPDPHGLAAFLAPPPDADEADVPDPLAGGRIGPYRLLRVLGRGGMGTVYLAERDDGHFRKTVAVKLVRLGLEDEQALRRFRHERQILATLEHPNIARLLDGGVSDDRRPYLVMEHVEGEPLDRYCDARRLSVEARLALFTSVCEAVRYAHRNLVVHRDLKPSNILVSETGQVKLLDFGIAKLLDPAGLLDDEAPGDALPLTHTGLRLMTPAYAAPEQIRGEAVTTATDVYALGVILYELLTGHRPCTAAATSRYEVERAVLEAEPERPSTVVTKRAAARGDETPATPEAVGAARGTSPKLLQRRLRGDLDTLLLTALRKEPERRYASADALLDDLRRHLAERPLAARNDTLGYRLATFARRNRWAVASAVLVFVSLVGGLSAALWQARRAAQERDVAVQVSAFLESLLSAADPDVTTERLDTLRLRDMIDRSALKVRRELADQPPVQSRMLQILGRTYVNLGRFDAALPLLQEALALRRQRFGAGHPAVAETQATLADLHYQEGRYDEAEQMWRAALTIYGRESGDLTRGQALHGLAQTLQQVGAYDEAERTYRASLDVLGAQDDPETRIAYGRSANALAYFYYQTGDFPAAESLAREALRIFRETQGPRHANVAFALNQLGLILAATDHPEASEGLFRECISILRETFGTRHPFFSTALANLADFYDRRGNYDAADSLYAAALDADRALLGPGHPDVGFKLRQHGLSRYQAGDYARAEHLLRDAKAVLEAAVPDTHFYLILTRVGLGKVLTARGALAESEALLRASLAQLERQFGRDYYIAAVARRDLGACMTRQQRFSEAEPLLVESYAVLRAGHGDGSPLTREAVQRLAELYDAWGRPADAGRYRALLADAAPP